VQVFGHTTQSTPGPELSTDTSNTTVATAVNGTSVADVTTKIESAYLVLTGLAGFINCSQGIGRVNCVLEWDGSRQRSQNRVFGSREK
jgi:hypothetical protein